MTNDAILNEDSLLMKYIYIGEKGALNTVLFTVYYRISKHNNKTDIYNYVYVFHFLCLLFI